MPIPTPCLVWKIFVLIWGEAKYSREICDGCIARRVALIRRSSHRRADVFIWWTRAHIAMTPNNGAGANADHAIWFANEP